MILKILDNKYISLNKNQNILDYNFKENTQIQFNFIRPHHT